jgi:hypothetical protein
MLQCPEAGNFVFNFLKSGGHLYATKYLTFNDLSDGIPSLLLSCEIAIVAPFFLVAYSAKQYSIQISADEERSPRSYQGGPLGLQALVYAVNIIAIVSTRGEGIKARRSGCGSNIGRQTQLNYIPGSNAQHH